VKLKSVVMARAIWLFDTLDLNPKGKSLFPELFDWLKDQYHFEKIPKSVEDRDQHGGFSFTSGEFQVKEEIFIQIDLAVYNDGLVATTKSSTNDSEAFLSNLLDSLSKEYSLVFNPSMIRRKMYLSEINVETTGSLSRTSPAINDFAGKISSALGFTGELGFQPTGLIFGIDTTALPLSKQLFSGFYFERKVGAPFSENRFYSKAPLPTHQHLALLEELEKILV
jgi:hypothetical protein